MKTSMEEDLEYEILVRDLNGKRYRVTGSRVLMYEYIRSKLTDEEEILWLRIGGQIVAQQRWLMIAQPRIS